MTWRMVIAGLDPDQQKPGPIARWTKAYWEAVHRFDLKGTYPSCLMDDEGEDTLKATYGDNYRRLAMVKANCDKANLFRVNQNIRPVA